MTPYTLADAILDDPLIGLYLGAALLIAIWMVRVVFVASRRKVRNYRVGQEVAQLGHELAEARRSTNHHHITTKGSYGH